MRCRTSELPNDPGHTNMFRHPLARGRRPVRLALSVQEPLELQDTAHPRQQGASETEDHPGTQIETEWSRYPLGTAGLMAEACRVRVTHHDELFRFFAVKGAARLRFLTAQRDQRMMDQQANLLLKLDRPVAVGRHQSGRQGGWTGEALRAAPAAEGGVRVPGGRAPDVGLCPARSARPRFAASAET
jgi:hypothetical protein